MYNLFALHLTSQDLFLSFADARLQKEHGLQHLILHVSLKIEQLMSLWVCSRPAAVLVVLLHSNCHLYGCWPLAGREEYWCLPFPRLCWPYEETFFQAGRSCFLDSDFLSCLS